MKSVTFEKNSNLQNQDVLKIQEASDVDMANDLNSFKSFQLLPCVSQCI